MFSNFLMYPSRNTLLQGVAWRRLLVWSRIFEWFLQDTIAHWEGLRFEVYALAGYAKL